MRISNPKRKATATTKEEAMPTTDRDFTKQPLTEEELSKITDPYHPTIEAFCDQLRIAAYKEVGSSFTDLAASKHFTDSTYDGVQGDIDLLYTVTHLSYEGTTEELRHFLFSAKDEVNAPSDTYPIARYIGSNSVAENIDLLAPYIERITNTWDAEAAARRN